MNKKESINKSRHSRVSLSGISTLEKTKVAEVPDNNIRVRQYNKAFTLIELLVVVLIIGILAAIALPQYQKAMVKSRMVETLAIGRAITLAQEAYKLETGTYTNDPEDLSITIPDTYAFGLHDGDNSDARANIAGKGFSWDFRYPSKVAYCYAPVGTIRAQACKSITGETNCSDVMNGVMLTYCGMKFM